MMTDNVTVPTVAPKRRPGRPRKNSFVDCKSSFDEVPESFRDIKRQKNSYENDIKDAKLHIPAHLPPPVQPARMNDEYRDDSNVPKTDIPNTNIPNADIPNANIPETDFPETDFPNAEMNEQNKVLADNVVNTTISEDDAIQPPLANSTTKSHDPQKEKNNFNKKNCMELSRRCGSGSGADRNKKAMEFLRPRWREQIHNYHDVARSLHRLLEYKKNCDECVLLKTEAEDTDTAKIGANNSGRSPKDQEEYSRFDYVFTEHFDTVKPLHCLFCQYECNTLSLWKTHSTDCNILNSLLCENMKPAARRKLKHAISDYLNQNVNEVLHNAQVTTYQQSGSTGKQQRLDGLTSAYWNGGDNLILKVESAKQYVKNFWEEQWSEYKRALAWVFHNDSIATLKKTCTECSRTYINDSELNTHRLVIHHRNIMPMQCFFCDRRYCIKKSLRTHADTLHSLENIISIIRERLGDNDEAITMLGKALHTSWKRGRITT